MIGVNVARHQPDTLKAVMDREKLPWRSFADQGDIVSRWNLSGIPTFYAIDHAGVIRYKLADACRLSAAAIDKDLREAMPQARREALERLRGERLTLATAAYQQVIDGVDAKDRRRVTDLEKLVRRNSAFYLGDCAFELGDYSRAIDQYDVARQRYADDPASLVAMVQIVNSYVAQKKWDCIGDMPSQFADADSWQARYRGNMPSDPAARAAAIQNGGKQRSAEVANQYRGLLVKLNGEPKGSAIKYAEAFELNQYGTQASVDELKQLFPTYR